MGDNAKDHSQGHQPFVKNGFNSMEAIALLDGDNLPQSKIQRGQQKLLLKALRPLQTGPSETNMVATCDNPTWADRDDGRAMPRAIRALLLPQFPPATGTRDWPA